MTITVDTDVLIRAAVQDDVRQAQQAAKDAGSGSCRRAYSRSLRICVGASTRL